MQQLPALFTKLLGFHIENIPYSTEENERSGHTIMDRFIPAKFRPNSTHSQPQQSQNNSKYSTQIAI